MRRRGVILFVTLTCLFGSFAGDTRILSPIETAAAPSGSYWAVDAERCRKVWTELETKCAACITHCPRTWVKV